MAPIDGDATSITRVETVAPWLNTEMGVTAAVEVSGDGPNRQPSERSSPISVGVLIWLASELMFFAGLFAAYFVLKAADAPNWPPPDVNLDMPRTVLATVLLVISSATIHFSVVAAGEGRHRRSLWLLVTTVVLGTAFILLQAYDYTTLDFSISSHAYGSIYYLLTGFHGLHVIGGLIALAVVGWVVFSRGSRAPMHPTLQVASYYWHFVDVVWIAVFLTIFVMR